MEKNTGRKTKQLEVVWHEVANDNSHPTADQIYERVRRHCGRVYDVFVGEDEEILPSSLPQEGFTVTSHQLAFFGECKSCSK
jgi:Fe2+ or Zn2+ uptake regulation protein